MDFKLPEIGEGVYEAELVAWHVKPGDVVKRGQNLMEVLTDKATMEVPSPFAGTIMALQAQPGQNIKVGDAVLAYEEKAVSDQETRRPGDPETRRKSETAQPNGGTAAPAPTAIAAASYPRVAASPSVRYMARKLGIDLAGLHGSGPAGRILLDDLTARIAETSASEPSLALRSAKEPKADYGRAGTRIKLAGLRRKIAEHMVLAKRTIPHYTYVDECEVTDLIRLREQLKDAFAAKGVKLTYLAFFVKAVVAALKAVPMVNATLDESVNEIVLHDRYHIGVAVATPGGLVVPVVHDADKKDLLAVARDVDRLSTETRAGKVKLDDLRGGTFTITSIGGIGGLISTPVINHPEVGILGVGKIVKRPVYDSAGHVRPADLMYLSLSMDHRVVDGAVGAAFANVVIEQLQKPAAMLLG